MNHSVTRRSRLYLAPLLLAGCAITPPERHYEPEPPEAPESWAAAEAADDGEAELERWWRELGDDGLAAEVERALAHNRDLVAAAARVEAAAAQARIAGAALEPTVDLAGDAQRGRVNFIGLPVPGGEDRVLSSTATTLGVSLDVAWEWDLWGRLSAGAQAAASDHAATRADLAGARLSIAGQTAKAWIALAAARLQSDLARETVESFRRNTDLVRRRYEHGRIEPLELRLAENNLATAESLLARREEQVEHLGRQLQVLTGSYPDGEVAQGTLPDAPAAVPAGVPSDILQRRPDLVAAEARLAAADLRLYEARKALWPSIRLTGSAGRTSTELEDLLESDFDVWSLAGGIVQPILAGGRLRDAIGATDARAREALASYGQRALAAFGEVEAALAAQEHLADRERALERAAAQAQAAQELSERQYRAGTTNLLAVLESQRRALNARIEHIAARRALLDDRVDLYLALGGGFDARGEWDGDGADAETDPEALEGAPQT